MRRAFALILALVMTMALVACGGDKPTSSTPATPSNPTQSSKPAEPSQPTEPSKPAEPEKPAEPKILVRTVAAAATSAWGMVSAAESDTEIQGRIHCALYGRIPVDGKSALVPVLAAGEPVDVNGDGKTWRVTISDKAKWSNGEPITADTYMYTFKMCLDPKLLLGKGEGVGKGAVEIVNASAYYQQNGEGKTPVAWEDVGFKKVDDMTIEVTLTGPANATMVMRQLSTSPIYQPLFEQCLSADGTTTTYGSAADKIIGAGPFVLTNWVNGSVREFEKNPNYIFADMIKLDGVKQLIVEDKNTQLQMFIKGEIDNVSLDAAGREQYGDDPRVVTVTSNYTRVIDINTGNTEKPILKNENFRKALYYATDRATIAKLSGDSPATGYCNPLGVAYTDGTTLRQLAAQAGYEPANNGYDPVKAKEYFDKAMQEEGLTTLEISLLCSSGTSDHTFISEYVQEDWQKIFGADKFKLNIDAQPSKNRLATLKSSTENPNAYELGISDWSTSAGLEDPLRYLQVYLGTYSSRNAPFDIYPELIEIYNAANTPENKLNEKVRAQAAMDMEKYMIEHAVSIPTIYNSTYQMVADRIILALDEYDTNLGWGWNFVDIAQ